LASETTAAIASWRKAGDLAISHRAYVEAREPYQQALAMLSTLPESPERDAQEIYLISALADVLSLVKGYTAPEFADATRHARILAEKTGNLVQLVHRLHGTWTNVQVAGNYAAAAALADQVLDSLSVSAAERVLALRTKLRLRRGTGVETCWVLRSILPAERPF
jgi:hypothetical protein